MCLKSSVTTSTMSLHFDNESSGNGTVFVNPKPVGYEVTKPLMYDEWNIDYTCGKVNSHVHVDYGDS